MKKARFLVLGLIAVLSLGAYEVLNGTITRTAPREQVQEVTVTAGTAVWISATSNARVGTVDLWVKSAGAGDTYWKIRDLNENLATVDNDGATLAATTGWITIPDVPWNWGIEAVGTAADVQIWEGGKR